ncbi:cold-inducible protein YdjO-related protein [Cohnella zeiphila]|uniref:cold-inducible protein YdjO-related protein n=1 Tax=Cohnella zeiphila TaxID=2761120 RepID=UPI00307FE9BE
MTAGETNKPKLSIVNILKCKNGECKAWVREEFAVPGQVCPICQGPMLRTMKHLPPLQKKIKPQPK